jgi:hypothetical protein
MNKRSLHHFWTLLRKVHLVFLLAIAIGFGVSALFALRANNQRMIDLRTAVFQADEQGGDIEGSLRALREYVHGHMNTDLSAGDNPVKPPIQLKYEYDRLVAAEKARFEAETARVGAEAQSACSHIASQTARFPCVQNYVNAHSSTVRTIPEDKYKFDFASPTWSPDLAGWSIVGAAVFALLFVLRLLSGLLIRRELKQRY